MKTIAFVDDEKKILDGLRRMLRHHRKDWDMHFYCSGEDMLEDLRKLHFDAVVSDMRMPKMNGPAVLDAIKQQSPDTVRLALSGYAEMEMILESVHATHQFIAKPAEQEKISQSISRAMKVQDSLLDEQLRSALGSVESLPTLPAIYDELMQEMASDDASIDAVGSIVERDIGLSTSLLKIVNSAFFGLVRHVESPKHAASILGMEAVKNLALSTSVFSSFAQRGGDLKVLEQLNIESQQCGILAARLGKESQLGKRGQDHAQIAGMMCNLGELIALTLLDDAPPEGGAPLLASYLLGIWALPFPVIEAVRWHRSPATSGINELSPLTVVHCAWSMLQASKASGEIDLVADVIDVAYLEACVGQSGCEQWQQIAQEFCAIEA